MWTTRLETEADIPVVRQIVLAAFGQADEADLVDALRQDAAWIDGLSWVAVNSAGDVGGYTLLTRCHVGETPALCLAPVAVLPRYQKTGAGSAVVRSALAAALGMGERFVTVLGHPAYYPKFGFGRASAAGIRLSVEVPDEAMMAMSLDGSPLPSGIVRYAKPFGI